jgi:hypothetical protein
MAHKHLLVDAVTEWEVLKHFIEQVIYFQIILGFHFSFKSIHFIQISCFVVASTHEKVVWVADFPREEGHNNFN